MLGFGAFIGFWAGFALQLSWLVMPILGALIIKANNWNWRMVLYTALGLAIGGAWMWTIIGVGDFNVFNRLMPYWCGVICKRLPRLYFCLRIWCRLFCRHAPTNDTISSRYSAQQSRWSSKSKRRQNNNTHCLKKPAKFHQFGIRGSITNQKSFSWIRGAFSFFKKLIIDFFG